MLWRTVPVSDVAPSTGDDQVRHVDPLPSPLSFLSLSVSLSLSLCIAVAKMVHSEKGGEGSLTKFLFALSFYIL